MKNSYILLLFITFTARANTYYFSTGIGDDSRSASMAQHAETPWKTLTKLNAIFNNLQSGDSILFKRGETFTGTIQVTRSGSDGQPIVFSAFGNGSLPVLTGFSKLSGWISTGNGIWRADCPRCGQSVNMVSIGGKAVSMGRTPNPDGPNEGYFIIQSHVKKLSITDDNLGSGPDWTGAEAVIRKNRFCIDKSKIISQSGNTISLTGKNYYEPTDKFGYFIQNDIRTLDRKGEWYYDPGTHSMNLFYGNEDPSSTEILASSVETLVSIKDQRYLVFNGLAFQGSNLDVFNLSNTAGVSVTDCRISFSGLNAVKGVKVDKTTIGNVSIQYTNNNAIDLNGTYNMIRDNRISQTGTIPGMGAGEASYLGINVGGTGNTVQYNQVDTTGYVGIFFLGSSNMIRNNVVDYFAFLKDDGGGIYTWSGDIDSSVQRNTGTITGNIVLNGITAPAGTDKKQAGIAIGIYLDENSGMLEVSGNTVSRCTGGIFLQDAHEVTVKGNTLYDNGFQLSLRHPLAKGTLRNNTITDNTAVARTGDQTVLTLSSAVSGEVTSYAEFQNNKYAHLAEAKGGGGSFFRVVTKPPGGNQVQSKGNMDQWKSGFGKDMNSRTTTPAGQVLFEFNKNKTGRKVSLNGTYTDLSGQTYQGDITLAPFSSVLLFKK